ncbi:MAG: acetate--CoA ligase family protein [Myxococcota bacterium]
MSGTLSEYESKRLLAEAGIPVPDERLVATAEEAVEAAEALGYPVVLKLCGRGIAHKTERNLVRLDLTDEDLVHHQAEDLLERRRPQESDAGILVATEIQGRREVIAGLLRDAVFGPCVMLGLGGIFAEALGEAAFAVAPLHSRDAEEMIDALAHARVLGEFRGEPPVDRTRLGQILEGLARIGLERPDIHAIDLNPVILAGSEPIIADALVELETPTR